MAEPPSCENSNSTDIREVLDAIGQLRTELDAREPEAVARARAEGLSWKEIAHRLGKAPSSVFERYRDV